MLSVTICINNQPIFTRTAVRKARLHKRADKPDDLHNYLVDDGSMIQHHFSDGAVVLAKKLLDTIKE